MPSSASTPTALPTTASTGACIPGTASTATTALSSASAGIPVSSGASTPPVMSTNATTGTSKPNAVPVYLPEEELNRYLNMLAVQKLIPNCFWKILECGYFQKNTDPIYKYLTVTKRLSNTKLKDEYNISGKDVKTIKDNPSHMDAPLLRKVIRLTCAKLKEDEWGKKDERQTECLIDMLTECRNKVCHEIITEATSPKMFEEIVRLLEALIRVGGTLYQRPSTEIDEELDELQRKIDIVTTSEHERELIALQHLFHTNGYAETKRYWEKYCNHENHMFSNLPTTHENVFYPLDVLLISSTAHNRPISYQELFHCPVVDDNRPVLILQGEAGSGKSSILMQIGLQFFKLIENRMPSLEEFHLLHFLQCNNHLFNDLKDFIRNYFPETCKIVSPEKVLECFPYLGNLILIDGYDEVNTHSVQVTKAFIEAYKNNPTCQIVFTARPNAVPGLGELLKKEAVQFNIYELVGISQEEKQLEFLRPFDCGSGLCLAFSALKPDVQSFFVRPINLVQFCSLFLESRDKVEKWESINDVMRDIMSQYETLITSKLNKRGIQNLEYFIKEVLQILNDFAFEGLLKRMFTLDKRACAQLSDDCFKKIKEWKLMSEVNTSDILSVVYVTKVTPTKDAVPTYQYSHKSMQELMSARSLLTDLTLDQNMTLEDIIRSRIRKVKDLEEELKYSDVSNGLLNVYKFILMHFSAPDKRPDLLRWLPELETVLTSAGADWQNVMMSCDRPAETGQDEVAKIAAKQKLAASREWEASTARDVMAIARMLPHAQLDELDVRLPESEGTPSELVTIMKMFTGHLRLDIHHSYETYISCDHILDMLNSSCSVTSLTGCLASSSVSTRSLSAKLQQPGALLDLTLKNPISHALQELQGTKHILNVRMKHNNPPTARPLPRGFIPPLLIVDGTPDSGAEELKAAILHYAPEGGVYFSLWLENTLLVDAAIQQLLDKLEEAGIRTCYHRGETIFTVACKTSDGLCLHCRKAHTDASQRCVWLQLADGVKGDVEEVRAWQSDLEASKALKEDGDQQNLNRLSSDDFAKFICYQVITTIVPDVMRRVIDWGCSKPASMTFLDFAQSRKRHGINNFDRNQKEMLKTTELDRHFNVSLLYHLILGVCENLEFNKIGPRAEESSVEDLLRSIMIANNDIVDRTLGVDAYLAHLSNFEDLCTKLIYATGKLYAVPMDSVDEEVTTTRSKFYEIRPWPSNFKVSHALRKDGDQGNFDLISSADFTRFSCRHVVETIFPAVVRRVIDWGCRKPEDMTFWDYISERKGKKTLRHANKRERQMLKKNKLDMEFDVILLYKLITLVCENLDFGGIRLIGKTSCGTVEGLLRSIKDARNEILHNPRKMYARSVNLRNFEDLCTKLIIAAGKLYAIDMDSVEKEVTTTRCKFYKVWDDGFMYSPASQINISAPTS